MKNKIGSLLKELRKEAQRTLQNAASGIMSATDLSKLENGERDIEYLLLETLFESFGKCIDKLELAVTQEEYELLELRAQIETALEKKDTDSAGHLIAVYKKQADLEKAIHLQYLKTVQILNEETEMEREQNILEGLEDVLKLTFNDESKGKRYPFHQEFYLIYMILYLKWKLGCPQICTETKRLEAYVSSICQDEETKVKIYPQCAWLLGKMLYAEEKYQESYSFAEKGLMSLRKTGGLQWMEELLLLKEECEEALGMREEAECRNCLEALAFLWEEAGIEKTAFSMIKFLKRSTQRECIICNSFLKYLREAEGMSQEILCENICAWETISRVESGRSPNKKKLFKMLKRLGVERERYYGYIESAHYCDYERARSYNRLIGKRRNEEAEKLLVELKNGLDLSVVLNRQFIEAAEVMFAVNKKDMSDEEAAEALGKLLNLTMPPLGMEEGIYRIPFRTEFLILNQIARCYVRMGRKDTAIELYKKILEQYKKDGTNMRYHLVTGMILYANLAGYLEEENRLEEAEAVAQEGLRLLVSCQRGDVAGTILANKACIYEKREEPERERMHLIYAYYLARFYKKDVLANTLKSVLEKQQESKN